MYGARPYTAVPYTSIILIVAAAAGTALSRLIPQTMGRLIGGWHG